MTPARSLTPVTSRAAFANRTACVKSASGFAVQCRRVQRGAGYGNGDAISPDLTHTEEAFVVNLDRVAVGAYVAVSVRADVSTDAADNALVCVVHAHMPGDIYVHWGLGSEDEGGGISPDAWECPPAELMPRGSRRVSTWASGAAVQSPIDPQSGTIEIPLPSRPGHGLAFVLFDAEKQCYYDHGGSAFFLNSALSASTALRATQAAKDQAFTQQTRLRAMAESATRETAVANAEAARTREEELRRVDRLANDAAESRNRERAGDAANKAAFAAAAAESQRENAADEAASAERRRVAAEKQAAYEKKMAETRDATRSAYERFVNDTQNPFRNFTPARAAAARGEDVLPGMPQTATMAATMAPPAGFVVPAAFANPLGGGGGGWDGASSSAATDHGYTPPPPSTPAYTAHTPTPVATAPAPVSASGAVVASHTIALTTESGSSTGTCSVSVMATWPPSVRIECRAGGAADGQPLLLHWGVSDRRGGSWMSPQTELQSVPPGSRAPDAQSCESALENGARVVEFAPNAAGATCMVMLIRTENCQEWLRETDGGDVFIDVSPALDLVRAMGPPDGQPQQRQEQRQEQHHHQEHHHEQHHHQERHHQEPQKSPHPSEPVAVGDHMALLSTWAGADVELKDHKGGKGDRHNRWNTDGLPDAARRIVENDRDSASYRQKLQKLEEVLCGDSGGGADFDALGYSAVYLFWVGVGAVACAEDGGHYRPNHHAETASRIYQHIENVENAATRTGGRYAEETRALIRRLHPRLPAFTAEFTQSVPLTRIRDIAHGKGDDNGRCREVRQEIKHTIQNKLHRCAGPEDLVATEKMLAKLTAPGTDYPAAFVEEFRIFHKELKDFFNASTVTDRIDKLLRENGDAPPSVRDAADAFSAAKQICDGITTGTGSELLHAVEHALGALSNARKVFDWELTNGGLQSASPDMRQQWRLAEIGLEEYAFVLLSRGINALGAETDPPRTEMSAQEQKSALLFLGQAADAVALSAGGGGGEEFARVALEATELAVADNGMPPGGENGALRSRAVAERARRASEDHCAMLADLFDGRASALGNALGIDKHVVEVFTEGQIRASVVFQAAKLSSHLLRAARAATGEAGWDCIVAGEVRGVRLVCVERLLPTDPVIQSLTSANPAVVLVTHANGDEEVDSCGPGVAGILLCHALPHLSHLALRSRQAKCPLVAIEDPALVNHARSLRDGGVHFVAQPGGNISLNKCDVTAQAGGGDSKQSRAPAQALVADRSAAGQVIDLVTLGNAEWASAVAVAGSKGTACAQLAAMASDPRCGFAAPAGAVLPFGSMEAAARAVGADGRLSSLVDALELCAGDPGRAARLCDELQELARSLRPSGEILSQLGNLFDNDRGVVMVRSTGNAEDLAGLSAAGLYDSVSNVNPHDPNVLGAAVAEVWASLFTTRAVGSRAAAGVGQKDAAMAVLVQQMLVPEVSFILMTKHPMSNDSTVAYAELALGHGETLASGAVRGTPWRMSMNRAVPGEHRLDAVASFSSALVPSATGNGELVSRPVNSGSHWMTTDEPRRASLARELVNAGDLIEQKLGRNEGGVRGAGNNNEPQHQDIEGCVTENGRVWIVQARPQP